MIRAMAKVREEFVLHLMLVTTPECLAQLKEEAKLNAPGRVIFEEPVPPAEVAARVSHFDVGLLLLENHSFNNRCALPNKVFEYVHGGLGVCSTRSPAMETFIQSHTNGWLIDEVSTNALADCLNSLTRADIEEKKAASLRARESVHAHGETAKMVKMLTEIAGRSAGQF
jgi:glycosyltransferase involved in cell wall biosynthesis